MILGSSVLNSALPTSRTCSPPWTRPSRLFDEPVVGRAGAAGVPCAPVNSIAKALKNPQVMARDMVFALDTKLWARSPMSGHRSRSAGLRTSGRTLLPSARTPARFLPRCSATTMPGSVPWRPTASLRAEDCRPNHIDDGRNWVLTAGAARVNIDPPLPQILQGFVRRAEPALTHGDPLLITAVALENDGTAAIILAADLTGIDVDCAAVIRDRSRRRRVCGAGRAAEFQPQPCRSMGTTHRNQTGRRIDEVTATERAYIQRLPTTLHRRRCSPGRRADQPAARVRRDVSMASQSTAASAHRTAERSWDGTPTWASTRKYRPCVSMTWTANRLPR